jgi:2Fe-2S ferredoxin
LIHNKYLKGRIVPQIIFLPNADICPDGKVFDAKVGQSILNAALENGIYIEHACEKSCACTTCHIIVREGFNSLTPSDELEDDMLDKAWGLEVNSRLGCQAILSNEDLVIEVPRYNVNMVSENY